MGMFQLERHKRSSVLSALLSLSLFFTQGSSLVWAADSGTGTSDTEAVQAQTVSPDGSPLGFCEPEEDHFECAFRDSRETWTYTADRSAEGTLGIYIPR